MEDDVALSGLVMQRRDEYGQRRDLQVFVGLTRLVYMRHVDGAAVPTDRPEHALGCGYFGSERGIVTGQEAFSLN